MNETKEIQYLGLMLTATTIMDIKRLNAITNQLIVIKALAAEGGNGG